MRPSHAGDCGPNNDGRAAIEQLGEALHHLCQPTTALQCRLEIAGMLDSIDAYRDAVNAGLEECARLLQGVSQARRLVAALEMRVERREIL
jgi:hypothetical protein